MAETKKDARAVSYPGPSPSIRLDCRPIRPPGIADDGRRHSAAVRDCLSSSDTAHIVSTTGDLMNCRLGLESTCRPSASSPPR
jgi:hypothetical protein